jgi:hypothetical protein
MGWLNKLKCYLTRHDFDKEKYERDLKYYYDFNNYIYLHKEEALKHIIENDPKPYCKRCKQEIV